MTTENTNCPTCGSDVIGHHPNNDGDTGYYEPITGVLCAHNALLESLLRLLVEALLLCEDEDGLALDEYWMSQNPDKVAKITAALAAVKEMK